MPYVIDGQELAIGVSIGVAIAPVDGSQAELLVRNADLALYRAKAEGGDCYCFFETTMDAEAHKRRELELELGAALERNEFALHYQPVVTAADSVLAGMEALIRWNHPTLGLVPAHEFMPLAERTGMIARIGEWTVNEACRALVQLPEHLTVAINLSTKHFRNADVFAVIQQALAASGVAPHRLELEVTESLLIDDSGDATGRLAELKKLGAMITLDHFGTGYSSLTGLLKFSFDKIKIDSSLVSDASDEAVSRETVRAIMALARTLKIAVATKGVETHRAGRVPERGRVGPTAGPVVRTADGACRYSCRHRRAPTGRGAGAGDGGSRGLGASGSPSPSRPSGEPPLPHFMGARNRCRNLGARLAGLGFLAPTEWGRGGAAKPRR